MLDDAEIEDTFPQTKLVEVTITLPIIHANSYDELWTNITEMVRDYSYEDILDMAEATEIGECLSCTSDYEYHQKLKEK